MTRSEVKKQIDRGWLNNLAALAFLGVHLDTFDSMARMGMLSTKVDRGVTLYNLDDVLAASGKTTQEVLNKHWPVDRRKKATRQQRTIPLKTQTEREGFQRKWFRLHRHLSSLIAAPKVDIRVGELKLFHQLMTLAYRAKTFDLVLTTKELHEATGLDDDALRAARRGLESRNALHVDIYGTPWTYRLLDPRTGQPLTDAIDDDIVVTPSASWANVGLG